MLERFDTFSGRASYSKAESQNRAPFQTFGGIGRILKADLSNKSSSHLGLIGNGDVVASRRERAWTNTR